MIDRTVCLDSSQTNTTHFSKADKPVSCQNKFVLTYYKIKQVILVLSTIIYQGYYSTCYFHDTWPAKKELQKHISKHRMQIMCKEHWLEKNRKQVSITLHKKAVIVTQTHNRTGNEHLAKMQFPQTETSVNI